MTFELYILGLLFQPYLFQNTISKNYDVLDSLSLYQNQEPNLPRIEGFKFPKDVLISGDNIYVIHSDSVEIFKHPGRSINDVLFTVKDIQGPDTLFEQDTGHYKIQKASSRYPCNIAYSYLLNGDERGGPKFPADEDDSVSFNISLKDFPGDNDSVSLQIAAQCGTLSDNSNEKNIQIREECPQVILEICGAVPIGDDKIAVHEGQGFTINVNLKAGENTISNAEYLFLLGQDTLRNWSDLKSYNIDHDTITNGKELVVKARLKSAPRLIYSAVRTLSVGKVSLAIDSLKINNATPDGSSSFVVKKGDSIKIDGTMSITSTFDLPVPAVLAYSWATNDSKLNKINSGLILDSDRLIHQSDEIKIQARELGWVAPNEGIIIVKGFNQVKKG